MAAGMAATLGRYVGYLPGESGKRRTRHLKPDARNLLFPVVLRSAFLRGTSYSLGVMAAESNERTPRHPMRVVTRRTGLSAEVLRVWERRYTVVRPARSEGGHRLYSDADLDRLRLLQQAARGGRGIGRLASLSNDELASLIHEDAEARQQGPYTAVAISTSSDLDDEPATGYLIQSLEFVHQLDQRSLELTLRRAAITLSAARLVEQVLLPLQREIADRWHQGVLRTQHEHMASGAIRRVLAWLGAAFASEPDAPGIVVATPQGQRHEFGALFTSAIAQIEGWRVTYLGTELPAEDIASAAVQTGARAVAVSLVSPADDPLVADELSRLASSLQDGVELLVDGGAANSYQPVLDRIGARRLDDLNGLRTVLREVG